MNRLLLIDGNSLLHRAYHALPPLTDKKGEMANAVFGFSNMLIKAIGEVKPDHIGCAFDTGAPTFRHIEFAEYKAQRVAPPPDLYPQLPKVKKILDAFGIKYFEKEGYEADDLIATLVSRFVNGSSLIVNRENKKKKIPTNDKRLTMNIVILSGDRDVLQLVNGNVKVQMPSFTKVTEGKPGWGVLVGAKEVRGKYGIEPCQMVDYKSLIGDPSDNVPGILGIGPKTAAQLLQKYQTLENLFKHVKENPLHIREKLEAGHDIALAAKKLVELDSNVDLTTCLPVFDSDHSASRSGSEDPSGSRTTSSWPRGVVQTRGAGRFTINDLRFRPDWGKVRMEYEGLGFKSIVAKLSQVHSSQLTVHSNKKQEKSVNCQPSTVNQSDDQLKLV
ncbi:hypothetical protein A3C33_04195 [Candidatus Curtissbacteria bacterium RIFCSPHIGHO2_02_FULL_42_58]|nr:MAG: hypothetical protein A3C33_04195 [Candidatus Curtissbacteria bacterium RIFCSPHIGHO2_02_FULL_42_58]